MADERVVVVMEGRNNLSAPAKQAAADVTAVGTAAGTAAANAAALNASVAKTHQQLREKANKAREAAGAVNTLATAAMASGGSLSGMANAAGMLASQIGAMTNSAKIAAGAAGAGALIGVGITLAAVWREANSEFKVSERLLSRLGEMSDESVRRELARIDEKIAAATATMEMGGVGVAQEVARTLAARERRRLTAEREEVQKRIIGIDRRAAETSRKDRESEAERAAEKFEDDRKRAGEYQIKTANDAARAEIMLQKDRFVARKELIWAEAEEQKAAAATMAGLSDAQRTKVIENIERVRVARAAAVDEEREQARGAVVLEAYKQRMATIEADFGKHAELLDKIVTGAAHAAVRAQEGFVDTLKRLALEPIIARLEGIGVAEGIEALLEAAMGNFVGAARHGAVAAAAIAGARKIAGWAGGGGSGGGVGAGGMGGGGTTFEPRGAGGGAGGQTINIFTIDPTSRAVVGKVRYELNRADVLNQPMMGGGVRVVLG